MLDVCTGSCNEDAVVLNAETEQVGFVDENLQIRDMGGNVFGTVGEDGTVLDTAGNVMCKVDGRGTVLNGHGDLIGRVVGPAAKELIQAAGAAALLLIVIPNRS